MTKGKPWPVEDERKLRDWFVSGTTELRVLAFSFDNKYTENAIYQKLLDVGLLLKEEEDSEKKLSSSSTAELELPPELPSIEEELKKLSAALKALEKPGLDKNEILRLRGIISGVKTYNELLDTYADYRGLEAELLELNRKYGELLKKSQDSKPK
jgi:hypothetical protein